VGIDKILHFRSLDSTSDINARLAGLIPKGVLKGGLVIPEPDTLQVRIVGDGISPWVFLAFSSDGMLLRNTADEIVLPVLAGTTNVIVLRAQYVESGLAMGQAEVMTLGAFNNDPNPASLIRLASVAPAVGSTAVLTENIDLSFRDSIEGFSRAILRDVVSTVADLPAVSGFPATAEMNFVGNDFVENSAVTVTAQAITVTFPIVPAVAFPLAPPTLGLSRINPSQAAVVSAIETALTGSVLITTSTAHGYIAGNQIRLTGNSAITLNGLWTVSSVSSPTTFTFIKQGSLSPASGTGGTVVNTTTVCTVTAKTATGVIHNLTASQPIVIQGAVDPSFNVASTVTSVLDGQTFTFTMAGFATAQSGGGEVLKIGISVPANGVQIGTTATQTALNFEQVFQASTLASVIQATALGSSNMFQTILPGAVGNTYTLTKVEPGVVPGAESIVVDTFSGGANPVPGIIPLVDLQVGDIYVVLFGSSGSIELWGFDGELFRNLTSSSFGTLLDYHRRNLFVNEKHLTENQQAALKGTVGTPGPTNLYVTQQDTAVLSADLGAALQGADNQPPNGSNRFLTEARYRGQRGDVPVPGGQNWVQLPAIDGRWVVGKTSTSATQFFNVVFTSTLNNPGGPTEYTQKDFTPLKPVAFYNATPFGIATVLDPSDPFIGADAIGIYPRLDAAGLGNPIALYVELTAVPDNGACSVLYSRAAKEKERLANADMLAGPQRILPAEIADLQNKVSELRFNTGIGVSGTTINFPANLFANINDQDYYLRRPIGGALARNINGFSIDFSTGVGTAGIVNSFTPLFFTGAGVWTRYVLTITQEGLINVYPVENYRQYASDLAYGSTLAEVAIPNLAFTRGEWLFASVGVESTAPNAIATLDPSSVEIYPFNGVNAREAGAVITCGDGTTSFGHFSGPSAINLAMTAVKTGDTIKVLPGTYVGQVYIPTGNININFCAGAVLKYKTSLLSLTPIDWDIGSDIVTFNLHGLVNNQAVTLIGAALPAGLFSNTTYYAQVLNNNDFKLSLTVNGPTVNFTTGGVGTVLMVTHHAVVPAANWVSPVITTTSPHGLYDNLAVRLSTTGSLPLGLSSGVSYYIKGSTSTTFRLALSPGGASVVFSGGAGVHSVSAEHSGIIVDAGNVHIKDAHFSDCDVGIHVTANGGGFEIENSTFDASVVKNFEAASSVASRTSTVATYTCTDGFSDKYVGDFNSLTAFADALAVASDGDKIVLYPGTYSGVTMSLNNVHVQGHGSGVYISGLAATPSIILSGDGNIFDNIICTDATVGIKCLSGLYNTWSASVLFTDTVVTNIEYPPTTSSKHFNFHPQYSSGNNPQVGTGGNSSRYVTVGDGVSSWGDYVGATGINQALLAELSGTTIRVGKGIYSAINTGVVPFNNMNLEGSGEGCIIRADNALLDLQCIKISGSGNWISGFHLDAVDNNLTGFNIAGILVSGDNNVVEKVTCTETGTSFVPRNKRFVVKSGFHNRYIPHDGAATDVVSWTVGDGIRSFGDFVGISSAFTNALNFLPALPGSAFGNLSAPAGSQIIFQDFSAPVVVEFLNPASSIYINSLHRYITLQTGANQGTWKVVAVNGATSLTLERFDGGVFTAEANVQWSLVVGTKLVVLPGTYTPITLGSTHNDVDIEAWGNGSDVIVSGGTPLLKVDGSRCRVSGFRFEDSGVAVEVNGKDNFFEKNRFAPTLTTRYQIGASATGNIIKDGFENSERVAYTVSPLPSRGDFAGNSQVAIQAAVDAAAADPQVKRVYLGAGTYTLTAPVVVPINITIFGSGFATTVVGDSTFPAFTLTSGNTISGINFINLTNSLLGPATDVFAYGNWGMTTAPIHPNVSGSVTNNLP